MWISAILLLLGLIAFSGGFGFIAALLVIVSIIVFINSNHDGPDTNRYA